MSPINPDLEWYTATSKLEGVTPRCPFANVHRCPRYYSSLYLLGDVKLTTRMKPEKIRELDALWDKSDVLPVVAEHDTGITSYGGKTSSYSNFCPEISFDVFGLFADYLHRYADEIDRNIAHDRLKHKVNRVDWRWQWESVSPLHYLKCPVYSQLLNQSTSSGKTQSESTVKSELVELKPGVFGINLNVRELLTRLARWWLSRTSRINRI